MTKMSWDYKAKWISFSLIWFEIAGVAAHPISTVDFLRVRPGWMFWLLGDSSTGSICALRDEMPFMALRAQEGENPLCKYKTVVARIYLI